MSVERVVRTDVLVVGGGGAACRASIAAHDAGARTIQVLKGEMGRCGATVAPGKGVAWQAADECSCPDDSPDAHCQNILNAGLGMTDPRLARLLAYEVIDRMHELEAWGLKFVPDPTGKSPHFSAFSCFGDHPRAHCLLNSGHGHAGDIVVVLQEQMQKRGIEVHERVFVTDLLVQDGVCCGALAIGPDGETVVYQAAAVVLGTGGARQLYPPSSRPKIDTTGDGYAMALAAGAELANMEFAQFALHLYPQSALDVPGMPWALFPQVRNALGDDAIAPYLPAGVTQEQVMWDRTLHYPFSSRDHSKWLDVAVHCEIRAGRATPEGGLWVDFSQADLETFKPSRPNHIPEDYDRPVVLPDFPLQVRPSAHAINGGVLIDERAQSSLPGLFAAGEVASGPHGADRLGGGMVTNCQVFGERAGRFAARHATLHAAQSAPPHLDRSWLKKQVTELHKPGGGDRSPADVLQDLQAATDAHLMPVRNAQGLQELLDRVRELKAALAKPPADSDAASRQQATEVRNLIVTAQLMATAALTREESRGSHFREDFPQMSEGMRHSIVFRLDQSKLILEQRSLESD